MIKMHLPSYCYSKKKLKSIDGIVIHFVSAKNILPKDPFNLDSIMFIFKHYKVSANYLIRRDGTTIELIPEGYKAYHAGKSIMNGREDCNDFTVGIELEGGTGIPFTEEQILELGTLSAQLMTKNKFTSDWIQGHDEVRSNWNKENPHDKRSVKVDPGSLFPWDKYKNMLENIG